MSLELCDPTWNLLQSIDIKTKPYYLVSIIRINNEESFLYEWLVHCLLNGFNHVYVYDNSVPGFDAKEVLQPFVDVGYVSYFNRTPEVMLSHPFHVAKMKALHQEALGMRHVWLTDECLQTFRQEMKWIVTTDVDEFWITSPESTLAKFLRNVENATNIIAVAWHLMRPMGFWGVSQAKLKTQSNLQHCSLQGITGLVNCFHPKYIIKAASALRYDFADEPVLRRGARVWNIRCDSEHFTPFETSENGILHPPRLQLEYMHYHSKTFEEMLSKRHRGWANVLKPGERGGREEVITPDNSYCPENVSNQNEKLAAFAQKIAYYMEDLPNIPFRRFKPSCPPRLPYQPGQEPPDERKWLYFESKFDQCLQFSESKYQLLAGKVANRPQITWPLLYDFVLNADFSGNLSRYDVFFEPSKECYSTYKCPVSS